MTARSFLRASLFAVAVATAACGGPSDLPPKPLATHFDDMYIAQIPIDQKQQVISTQNAWQLARMENAKAEADLGEAGVQVDIATNEKKAAKLAQDSALSSKKAAEQSADQNRVNDATRALRAAELAVKAAEQRVTYLIAYKAWLGRLVRFSQENMYYREAQYELAKAELAKKNNIAPKGFSFETYPTQEQERAGRVGKAKDKAEALRAKALEARGAWQKLQTEADTATGQKTQFPDPMAAKPVKGTDPAKGAGGFTIGNDSGAGGAPPPVDNPAAGAGAGSGSGSAPQ
jgi:hypothetical protein